MPTNTLTLHIVYNHMLLIISVNRDRLAVANVCSLSFLTVSFIFMLSSSFFLITLWHDLPLHGRLAWVMIKTVTDQKTIDQSNY